MKEIKAVIGPQRLEALRDALRSLPGFPGMTVSRAEGYAAPVPHVGPARHSIKEELTDHVSRLRVEIIASDELAPAVFDCVVKSVSAGSPGDSIVWMCEVARSVFVHKTVGAP